MAPSILAHVLLACVRLRRRSPAAAMATASRRRRRRRAARSRAARTARSARARSTGSAFPPTWNGDLIIFAHGYVTGPTSRWPSRTTTFSGTSGRSAGECARVRLRRDELSRQRPRRRPGGRRTWPISPDEVRRRCAPIRCGPTSSECRRAGWSRPSRPSGTPSCSPAPLAACGPIGDFVGPDRLPRRLPGGVRLLLSRRHPRRSGGCHRRGPRAVDLDLHSRGARGTPADVPAAGAELLAVTGAPFDPLTPPRSAPRWSERPVV